MKCKPFTSLLEPAADCSPTSSSGTPQSEQLSLIPTAAESCENAPQTDGSRNCTCMKETFGCSIHPNTPDEWIAFMRASLARILALPENRQALAQKRAVASTVKSSASLALFDPVTCSLRTSQQSLLTDSEPSSLTLPRSGMTRNGYVYELPIVGRITTGIDGGYWPTPTRRSPQDCAAERNRNTPSLAAQVNMRTWPTPQARDFRSGDSPDSIRAARKKEQGWSLNLNDAVKLWPTPTASLGTNGGLVTPTGGKLNPVWVEWLIGWPLGWTGLKLSATVKSRSRPRSRGKSSEGRDD